MTGNVEPDHAAFTPIAATLNTPLTFEECRRHADALLTDALTDLRHHTGLTTRQVRAIAVARTRIREALHALALAAPSPTQETT